MSCSEAACALPSCLSVRRLLYHWVRCQDLDCRLCGGVWRDLSGLNDHARAGQPAHVGWHPLGRVMDVTPPEQPTTPLREGPDSRSSLDGRSDAGLQQLVLGAPHAAALGIAGGAAGAYAAAADMDVEFAPQAAPPAIADRAVMHLLEVTAYMRYLLQTLMSRTTRDAPSSAHGLDFWLSVAAPEAAAVPVAPRQLYQHPTDAAAAAAPPPPEVLGADPAAMVAAAHVPARLNAGRRLLQHRLMCGNGYCAVCSGTCELFTRGHALRNNPALPAGLHDMDDIVQELSLALNNINL